MIDINKYEGCIGWWDIMDGVATPTDPLWIARNTFDSHALTTDCDCDAFEELKDTCTMSRDTMCQNLTPFVEAYCDGDRIIADMGFIHKATLKEQRATATLIADAPLLLAEVKRLREQVSKAKEWVRSYFINMSGDFNSLEDKVVYDDFMQQMGMKKND